MASVSAGWSWGSAWGDEALDEQEEQAGERVSRCMCLLDLHNFWGSVEVECTRSGYVGGPRARASI